ALASAVKRPYETGEVFTPVTEVDRLIYRRLEEKEITPAHHCSDAVFLRRAFLDLTGSLPPVKAAIKFPDWDQSNKRQVLVEVLLQQENYADYWAMKWSDLLRVKAEFPINLWPNAVQAYHSWIRHAIASNMPYDQFARELLTSSGSNFRVPQVNFYRAIEGTQPESIAAAVALTFMGVRFESLSPEQRANLAHIFSRVAYKKTDEWKEEIVHLDPAQYGPMDLTFPDGTTRSIGAGEDPRVAFADWLIRADNPWFARAIANRAWSWLMGRGLIHEPDDIRPDNPCVNPELLAFLEGEMVGSGFDMKHLFRLILNSRTYQQSAIPQSTHPEAESLFAHYSVRRLDAEVLIDALGSLAGSGELYQSPVPEPFTFVPDYRRTISLSDGSITSQFLEKFGRPARDTGMESERNNEVSVDQVMYLLNSSDVQAKIKASPWMKGIMKNAKGNGEAVTKSIYYLLLSRAPTRGEINLANEYFAETSRQRQPAFEDLCWALINSKEFLYRH
ncbi:MAG TPA: DUF1553 domain-containing protein, partial [Oceanipulchritudo sp.]|nr:DUF1553 domain-containing protein [Oceanipulchritudo sp.]